MLIDNVRFPPARCTAPVALPTVCEDIGILAFQDWLSMDEDLRYPDANAERINVPANPRHYWRYRMHLTLEDLMKNKAFNKKMTEMIDEAGRY